MKGTVAKEDPQCLASQSWLQIGQCCGTLKKSADVGVLPTEILILDSGLWLSHTANIPCRILNMQSD